MKTSLVTGITGQDGAWLAKFLLSKGYKVFGAARRNSQHNTSRLEYLGIKDKIKFVDFELTDQSNVYETIRTIKPAEIYNLGAQSFVASSFKIPVATVNIDFLGTLYLLEGIRQFSPETKFYQASTSEMFGKVQETPQKESTPFYPRSPYGVAKLASHWMTINYRESYKLFTASGILFNHESELRGEEFVTKKITMTVATWYKAKGKVLEIGNMESQRDWGYAKEYVEGMYEMLQTDKPDTFVLATGITTRIRKFVELAFKAVDREIIWKGKGINEEGYDKKSGELLVKVNPEFYRPAEVDLLVGDFSKAKKLLNWSAKTKLDQLVEIMVKYDIDKLSK